MEELICEKCKTTYSRKDKFKAHLLTQKHLLSEEEKLQKIKDTKKCCNTRCRATLEYKEKSKEWNKAYYTKQKNNN